MEDFNINCVVLESYMVTVTASSEEEALAQVKAMSSMEIAEVGKLKSIEVDYVEPA